MWSEHLVVIVGFRLWGITKMLKIYTHTYKIYTKSQAARRLGSGPSIVYAPKPEIHYDHQVLWPHLSVSKCCWIATSRSNHRVRRAETLPFQSAGLLQKPSFSAKSRLTGEERSCSYDNAMCSQLVPDIGISESELQDALPISGSTIVCFANIRVGWQYSSLHQRTVQEQVQCNHWHMQKLNKSHLWCFRLQVKHMLCLGFFFIKLLQIYILALRFHWDFTNDGRCQCRCGGGRCENSSQPIW